MLCVPLDNSKGCEVWQSACGAEHKRPHLPWTGQKERHKVAACSESRICRTRRGPVYVAEGGQYQLLQVLQPSHARQKRPRPNNGASHIRTNMQLKQSCGHQRQEPRLNWRTQLEGFETGGKDQTRGAARAWALALSPQEELLQVCKAT